MNVVARVLFVEDNIDDALLLERQLRHAGLSLVTERVDTAAGLRRALNAQPWDVVLCDFDLPGFSGLQALHIVREIDADLPFLFVSGVMGEDVAVRAMRAGAHDYVLKSHLQRLAPAVEREIREAHVRRERRRAESALRESELRFLHVYESSVVGIAYWNADQRIAEANDAFLRMVGYTRDDLRRGKVDWRCVTPPAYAAADAAAAAEIAATGNCRPYKKEFVHPDGTRVPVLVSAARLNDPNLSGVAMLVDIGAERRAERERTEAHALISAMVESTPLPIILLDAAEQVSLWNPAATTLFGWSDAEVRGHPLPLELATLDGEPVSLSTIDGRNFDRHARAIAWSEEMLTKSQSGAPLSVEVHYCPIHDADRQRNGTALVVRDLTEKRKLEAQLRQAQKMEIVGNLASGIAHDFNNLLSVIALNVELALGESLDRARVAADLETAREAAYRGAGLTRQLLNFSRPSGLTLAPVELGEMIRDTGQILERLLKQPNLHVEVGRAAEELWVLADRSQLEQILLNLAINARDAMPNGGVIRIDTTLVRSPDSEGARGVLAPTFVELSVRDSGVGIPPELLDRVFEPFFTTKAPGRGTGLGLASVREIVQHHGGSIHVESTVGVGTTFRVRLLRASPPKRREDAPLESTRQTNTATILLVEDEPLMRRIGERILTPLGHTVVTASDGVEALEKFTHLSPRPRLVITDLEMPGMGGEELAERLRGLDPTLPLLFVSGSGATAAVERYLRHGRAEFLAKPYRERDFGDALDRLLTAG